MKNTFSNRSKIFFLITLISMLLIFVVIFLSLYFTNIISLTDINTNSVFKSYDDQVIYDPTKINMPDWANLLLVIGIFVVIGLLSFGIIGLIIYILVFNYKKKNSIILVNMDEYDKETKNIECDGANDFIKVSFDNKGNAYEEK